MDKTEEILDDSSLYKFLKVCYIVGYWTFVYILYFGSPINFNRN